MFQFSGVSLTPICLMLGLGLLVRSACAEPKIVSLWEQGAPGFENRRDEPEHAKDWWVRNIHNPSLTVYQPVGPNEKPRVAVIVCAGGGHQNLVFDAEGADPAKFLSQHGVVGLALKYRLGRGENTPYSIEEHARQDGLRAMRLVRSRAAEWNIDPDRIGMLGFSAGAEVISFVAFSPNAGDPSSDDPVDHLNAQPNFLMYVYPGPLGIPEILPKDAPPAYLAVANDDEGAAGTIASLLTKYRQTGASVEAHIYAQGGHGFNMGYRTKLVTLKKSPDRMIDWLEDNFVNPPPVEKEP